MRNKTIIVPYKYLVHLLVLNSLFGTLQLANDYVCLIWSGYEISRMRSSPKSMAKLEADKSSQNNNRLVELFDPIN